jgi:hypothetical protein
MKFFETKRGSNKDKKGVLKKLNHFLQAVRSTRKAF